MHSLTYFTLKSLSVLIGLLVNLTQTAVIWENGASVEELPSLHQVDFRQLCGTFS